MQKRLCVLSDQDAQYRELTTRTAARFQKEDGMCRALREALGGVAEEAWRLCVVKSLARALFLPSHRYPTVIFEVSP